MLLPIYRFVHLYQEDLLISVVVHRPFIPDRVQLYFSNQPYYFDQIMGALTWVGLAGNVTLVSPTTHTHTQFTRGHQFWKWIKPAQKQINKSWLKWASASLPKTLNAWNLNHVSWCYDSIDIYSKLTVMPYVVLYCCNAVNLTAK